MITFFTIPKPFKDHIAIIQENAINSWLRLHPKCEIILYGDEEGIKEICDKYDLVHVTSVKKNEYGTPTLDFVFENTQKIAKNKILCYINADIVLFSDFITTVKRMQFQNFLIIGGRWNVEISNTINFEEISWEHNLRDYVIKNHTPFHGGIDYFIFPKGFFGKIPPFAVDRSGWDNWIIYSARKLNIPTIDATQTIMAIHQNHSYSHVPQQTGSNYAGPESDNNFILSGGRQIYLWNLYDVDWIITPSDIIHKSITLRECFQLLVLKSSDKYHPLLEIFFIPFNLFYWIRDFIQFNCKKIIRIVKDIGCHFIRKV